MNVVYVFYIPTSLQRGVCEYVCVCVFRFVILFLSGSRAKMCSKILFKNVNSIIIFAMIYDSSMIVFFCFSFCCLYLIAYGMMIFFLLASFASIKWLWILSYARGIFQVNVCILHFKYIHLMIAFWRMAISTFFFQM